MHRYGKSLYEHGYYHDLRDACNNTGKFFILPNYSLKQLPVGIDTLGKPEGDVKRLQPGNIPGATFSHTTHNGKIFLLPFDKMPCLVPDTESVRPMPIYRPQMKSFRTPNMFPTGTVERNQKIP